MSAAAEYIATCAGAALPDADGVAAGAPDWAELLPLGKVEGRDGRIFKVVDPQAVVSASFAANTERPIDYEHQCDDPSRRTNGPVPAAGRIAALEVRDGSLWGRVAWTDRATAMIGARE